MSEQIEQQTGPANPPSRKILLSLIGVAISGVFALAIFAGGFFIGTRYVSDGIASAPEGPSFPIIEANQEPDPPEDVSLDSFWEVWNTLEDRFYFDVPSDEERLEGAINGLIDAHGDPYTTWINPESARIMQEDNSGEFEGIGAYVEEAPDGGVFIIRAFEDGPAEQAGIRAGDIVIAVDGEDITGQTLRESLLVIRGPSGSDVTLTVRRGDVQDMEELDITVTRARLNIPTVEYEILEGNIGYVILFEFNARSNARLRSAIDELIDQGAESIILDLRNNPGGYLDESVSIADYLLPRGTILIQRDVDGRERTYTSRTGDAGEDFPLVVLINEGSASASEIVAAAVQDNERGTLIGRDSFGKGSVQLQYNLTDGSLLRVTYALWYRPADISISEHGVTPDILVETEQNEDDPETDVVLDRAVDYLLTGE